MAKRPQPGKSKLGSKQWLVTIPGGGNMSPYHVYGDTLTVTDYGALVFTIADGTVVNVFPPTGYSRVDYVG